MQLVKDPFRLSGDWKLGSIQGWTRNDLVIWQFWIYTKKELIGFPPLTSQMNLPTATKKESLILALFKNMMFINFNIIQLIIFSWPWKYFEWILLNSAFVWYEDMISRRVLSASAAAENTLLNLRNSSHHTEPRPIIANYTALRLKQLKQNRWISGLFIVI